MIRWKDVCDVQGGLEREKERCGDKTMWHGDMLVDALKRRETFTDVSQTQQASESELWGPNCDAARKWTCKGHLIKRWTENIKKALNMHKDAAQKAHERCPKKRWCSKGTWWSAFTRHSAFGRPFLYSLPVLVAALQRSLSTASGSGRWIRSSLISRRLPPVARCTQCEQNG